MAAARQATITIGGRPHAVGLIWLEADAPSRRAAKAAAARLPGGQPYDLVAVRPAGRAGQAGFGATTRGHKWGMPTAASRFAAAMGRRRVIGIFRAGQAGGEDLYWMCAVRDGMILGEADIVGTVADISQILQDHQAAEWDAIYAPEAFGIEGAETASLDALVAKARAATLQPRHMLSALMAPHVRRAAAVVVVVGGAGLLGWWAWDWWTAEAPPPEPVGPAPTAVPQPRVIEWPKPWQDLPDPLAVAQACERQMRPLPLVIGGWHLESAGCTADGGRINVHAEWRRRWGSFDVIERALPEAQLGPNGEVATLYRGQDGPPPRPAAQPAPEPDIWRRFHWLRQATGHDVTLGAPRRPQPLTPPAEGQVVPPPPFVERTWSVATVLAPALWAEAVRELSGAGMTAIRWDRGGWSLEGVVYQDEETRDEVALSSAG